MQDDDYVSDEEAEKMFERDLEGWETEPSYMIADQEKYNAKPTDAGTKVMWLKYTQLRRAVPDNVMERMIVIIERDVMKRPQSKILPDPIPEPVLSLIHLALSNDEENLRKFWSLLYGSLNTGSSILSNMMFFDKELLDEARGAFPEERDLDDVELFEFAARSLGLYERHSGEPPVELVRRRYKTFKKNF